MKENVEVKVILRDLMEAYNKNSEFLSVYTPLADETAQEVDRLVSYIKENY